MKRTLSLLVLGLALLVLPLLGGCANNDEITASDVRRNMSPELKTVAKTREQRKNNVARSYDYLYRQGHDDWDRFWMVHRPMRLSPYIIP